MLGNIRVLDYRLIIIQILLSVYVKPDFNVIQDC